jgi:hypothetical protein
MDFCKNSEKSGIGFKTLGIGPGVRLKKPHKKRT